MAKKEIPNAVFVGALVLVVLVLGVFLYRKATVNPPTPRPDPNYFGGGASGVSPATVPVAPSR
jgi:hypothetical protein